MSRRGTITLAAAVLIAATAAAAERSAPIDCLPDRIATWEAAAPAAGRFGASFLPGIVLGPPGDSAPFQGSFTVASLGYGGAATLALDDVVIEDRPGPDFIVFENAFFRLPPPASAADDFAVFAEPAFVDVSDDGLQWSRFPYDAQALAEVAGDQPDGSVGRALWERLGGLAGRTPAFTGNWTVPDDPAAFDPAGAGGVSGAGGDAFDLAVVGLPQARFVRLTDAGTEVGPAGAAEGHDVASLVVLHGRPVPPLTADADGDALSDLEEASIWLTDPQAADSDGDGTDDGRELAGCRDPRSSSPAPFLLREPRLWLVDPPGGCAEVRWAFMGSARTYDLLRGTLGALSQGSGAVALGPTTCLADDQTSVRWSCDGAAPPTGEGFYYLVRSGAAADWGRSSALFPRPGGSCP